VSGALIKPDFDKRKVEVSEKKNCWQSRFELADRPSQRTGTLWWHFPRLLPFPPCTKLMSA
jgi:hypothetical protein